MCYVCVYEGREKRLNVEIMRNICTSFDYLIVLNNICVLVKLDNISLDHFSFVLKSLSRFALYCIFIGFLGCVQTVFAPVI